jgi:hypothetical protein
LDDPGILGGSRDDSLKEPVRLVQSTSARLPLAVADWLVLKAVPTKVQAVLKTACSFNETVEWSPVSSEGAAVAASFLGFLYNVS